MAEMPKIKVYIELVGSVELAKEVNDWLANVDNMHGHVRKHPKGILARCGGPAVCGTCKAEQIMLQLLTVDVGIK
jgi:hypothetical protein